MTGIHSLVQSHADGAVTVLTLDHPDKRNALGRALIADLLAGLDSAAERRARAVILRAQPGIKVWSAGFDIDELPDTPRDPLGWSDPLRRLVRRIQEFPAPVIALLEGGIWGGACEVVFACDLVLATPEVSFALTPARLGVPYNVTGLKALMAVMPPAIVRELAFTARPMPVARAYELGLVNHILPAAEITGFAHELSRGIAANAPLSIAAMKESLRILEDAHGLAPTQIERLLILRNMVGESADYQEGLAAFRDRRSPVFRGE
jgi:methylmalonyl-CoA decarboxylase